MVKVVQQLRQLWHFCWQPQSAVRLTTHHPFVIVRVETNSTIQKTRCIRDVTPKKGGNQDNLQNLLVFTKLLSYPVRTLWHPSSKVTSPVTLPARVQLWITTRLAMFDPLIFAFRADLSTMEMRKPGKINRKQLNKNNQTNRLTGTKDQNCKKVLKQSPRRPC